MSEIVYPGGKFYLAAVRDAFSNKIVGWATSRSNDTDLVLAALSYAAWHRDYTQDDLIHHSDYAEVLVKPRNSELACAA